MAIAGTVTIGIPTRNRQEYVLRAVQSALSQTLRDVQVVVSDNASTDRTLARLREINDPRLKLLGQTANIGMAGNFNACLDAAEGEYFLMLSDDDVLGAEAADELRKPFVFPPDGFAPEAIALTWCPCTVIDSNGNALWETQAGPAIERSLELIMGVFNGERGTRFCGVMVRTADARRARGYNEDRYGAICDCGNWMRVAASRPYVVCCGRALARYTIHAGSETRKSAAAEWQQFGENIYADLVELLRSRGTPFDVKRLRIASRNHISNLIVTVLLQSAGGRGWTREVLREARRAPEYMLTPFVFRRCVRDGWKLFRLGGARPVTSLFWRFFRHIPPGQFGRYLMVGAWNTLFGFATFAAFTAAIGDSVPYGYVVACVLSSLLNISVAFLGYKWLVFRTKGNYFREWARCLAVYGTGTIWGALALPILVQLLRAGAGLGRSAPYIAGALLTCFGVIYNFLGHKKFSFGTANAVGIEEASS